MPPPPPTALPGPSIATAPRPGGLPGPKAVIPPSPSSNGNTNKAPVSIPASRPGVGIQAASTQQTRVLQKPALPKPGALAKSSTSTERQGGTANASAAPVPPGGSLGVRPLGLPLRPQAIPGKPRAPAPPKAPLNPVAQSSIPSAPDNGDNKTSSASANKLPGGQLPGPTRLPMPATPGVRPASATGPTRPPAALPGPNVYSKSGMGSATPGPPRSLPSFVGARAGPSESGFSAPPPPSGLPSVPMVPHKVGGSKPSSASATSAIPVRPLPPSALEKAAEPNSGKAVGIVSPNKSTIVQEDASAPLPAKFTEEPKENERDTAELVNMRKQPEEEPEENVVTPDVAREMEDSVGDGQTATDWKQCLHDLGDSEEEQASDVSVPAGGEDSGEDSDTAATANLDVDRHKNDMHVLLRQQPRKFHAQKPEHEPESLEQAPHNPSEEDVSHGQCLGAQVGPVVNESHVELACGEQQRAVAQHQGSAYDAPEEKVALLVTRDSNGPSEGDVTGEGFQKKGTLISRFFGAAAKSGGGSSPMNSSMLEEDISEHPDSWYAQQLAQLSKGKPCTKVATNGKPYERHFYVDAKNLTIEIQGGKGGCTGILLDDLVDILRGLSSSEFQRFAARVKHEESLPEVAERALVLKALHRTFSFIFSSAAQRQTVAHSLLFLLKSRNRGVMACSTPSGGSAAVSASAQAAGAAGAASKKCPKQGFGSVTYVNRSSYEGEFQNHLRHGHGVLTLSDGTRYESEWRYDERHGPGKEVCPDGTTFEGSYVKGMRHGHGVMTWPEGSQYSGQFERGRANGEGQLLRTDGSVYKGQFVEDCMSGDGRMQWRDGVEYKGQFVQNRREGQGTMLWTSGRWKSYVGAWKDGMQHGSGTLCDHRDQEFRGLFRQGKLERWEEGEGA